MMMASSCHLVGEPEWLAITAVTERWGWVPPEEQSTDQALLVPDRYVTHCG